MAQLLKETLAGRHMDPTLGCGANVAQICI